MKSREQIFAYFNLGIFILSVITDWYRVVIVVNFVLLIVMLLDKMGRGIILREIIALHTSFVCLLMPLIGYLFYTQDYHLSRIWVKYMPVPEADYFGFVAPATIGFILLLCWPMSRKNEHDEGPGLQVVLNRAKDILKHKPMTGINLMVFGIFSVTFNGLLPVVIQFAFYLFFFAAFSGLLYVYYAPALKRKVLVLSIFALVIFANALQSGMFTIIAYMSITLISFFFVGRKFSFLRKLSFFLIGLFLIFLLQSVKHGFRQQTWSNNFEGNRASLFLSLIGKQFTDRKAEPLQDAFFPIYVRGNQGYNISLVMRRIPQQQDFDNGANLFITIVSSFVPRVFWTDKPEAGGKFNMSYYAGFTIEGWSTNVGPVGEAYGSFGVVGGIIYMMFLGFVIRWAYQVVFRIGYRIPLLLFWIPMIFYQITYSSETDTLQITNSIIKSALFVWLLYKIWPGIFGVARNTFGTSKNARRTLEREMTHSG